MPSINIYEVNPTQDLGSVLDNYTVLVPGSLKDTSAVATLFTTKDEFASAKSTTSWKDSDNFINELLSRNLRVLVANTTASDLSSKEYDDFWKQFEDRGKYDITFIAGTFLVESESDKTTMAQNMIKLAATRGDCVALIDTIDDTSANIKTWCNAISVEKLADKQDEDTMKYGAAFAPSFKYGSAKTEAPATLAYLTCFAQYVENSAPWFAFAGKARGTIPFTNVSPIKDFGDSDINVLQTRTVGNKSCNTLATINPYGVLVWGNRTLHAITTSDLSWEDFLNIRMLCNMIKKQLYITARKYTFEPNDDVLWTNFTNDMLPLLNQMKSNRGIRAFSITKVETKEKAKLKAIITISPIEAVEDFDLTINLTDSVVEE